VSPPTPRESLNGCPRAAIAMKVVQAQKTFAANGVDPVTARQRQIIDKLAQLCYFSKIIISAQQMRSSSHAKVHSRNRRLPIYRH
jgi:6-phosphogluconate dehydrogenase